MAVSMHRRPVEAVGIAHIPTANYSPQAVESLHKQLYTSRQHRTEQRNQQLCWSPWTPSGSGRRLLLCRKKQRGHWPDADTYASAHCPRIGELRVVGGETYGQDRSVMYARQVNVARDTWTWMFEHEPRTKLERKPCSGHRHPRDVNALRTLSQSKSALPLVRSDPPTKGPEEIARARTDE